MINSITPEKFEQIEARLRVGGKCFRSIGFEFGVSTTTVSKISRGKHAFQSESKKRKSHQKPKAKTRKRLLPELERFGAYGRFGQYTPTPYEIVLACERIRETWDEERLEAWEPPVVAVSDWQSA